MFPSHTLDTTRAEDVALRFRKIVRVAPWKITRARATHRLLRQDTRSLLWGPRIMRVQYLGCGCQKRHFAGMRVVVVPVLVTRASTF